MHIKAAVQFLEQRTTGVGDATNGACLPKSNMRHNCHTVLSLSRAFAYFEIYHSPIARIAY